MIIMLRIVTRINILIVIITTICYQNQPVYSGDFSSSPLSSTSTSSSYKDKPIGCLYSDLCDEDQVCFDDHAFGRCEQYDPLTETFSSNYIYQLDRKTLQLLEKEWIRLRKSGFDWPDPYMQCILKVILNDRPRIAYNPTVCDKHLTSNSLKFEKNNEEDHIPYESKQNYDEDLFRNIERELANYLILSSSSSKEENESLPSSPSETTEDNPSINNDDKKQQQQQQLKRLKNLNKESLTLVPSAQLNQPSSSSSSSLSSSASSPSSSKIDRQPLISSLLIGSKIDNINSNNDESGTKNLEPVRTHIDLLQLFPKIMTTGALHANIPMMKKKDHVNDNNETNKNQKKSLIIDHDQVEEFPYPKPMIDANSNDDVEDEDSNDFDLEQNKKLIDFLEEIIKNGDNNDYGGSGRYYNGNLNDDDYIAAYKQLLDYYGNSKNNNPYLEEPNDPMMKRNNHLRNGIMNTIYFSKNNKQPSIESIIGSNNNNDVDEQVVLAVDDNDENQRKEEKQQRILSSPLMSILKIPEIRIIRDTEDDDYNDPLDHITLLESPPLLTTTPSDDDEDIVLVDFDSDNDNIIVEDNNKILHKINLKKNKEDLDLDYQDSNLNEIIDDKSLKNNLDDNNVESLASEKNGINDYNDDNGDNNNEEDDEDEEKEILIGDINYSNNYLMPNFNRHHRYDIKKPGPIYLEDYIFQSSLKNEADNNNKNGNKDKKDNSDGNSNLMKKDFSIRSNQPVAEGPVKLDSTSKDQLIIRTASDDENTNLEAIDSTHTYVVIDQMLGEEDSESFLQTIEQLFNLPRGTFSNIRKENYQITFKVNPNYQELNASQVASRIEDSSKLIQDITGYVVKETGIGDKTKLPVVSAKLMKQSNDKIIRMTLFVCTIILSFISAAFVIYLFRRNAKFREKIKGFMKLSEDWIKFDYQDLCRQKFKNKNENTKSTTETDGGDIKKSKEHGLKNIDTKAAMQQGTDSQGSPQSRSSTSSYAEEPVSTNMDITTGHIILSYMEDHLKNKNRLDREWEALCAYEADPNATNAALQKQNIGKNRYQNVLPYDHSRVILNDCANSTNSDYINANTITDHDPRNPAYIATQGPLPNTKADFWQMIWEQGSVLIVMLTRLRENGLNMCDRYWPEEGSEVFENFEVHLVSEHIWCDDYLVRSFYLKNLKTGETRTVTQFHYLSWPENGLPASIKSLLDFRRKVNKSYKGRSCPIVVHCNDGVGRTGTYILIDMVLNRLAKGAKEIDLAASLEHIRDQRGGMVKTKQQFEFVLLAIADEVQAILKTLPN